MKKYILILLVITGVVSFGYGIYLLVDYIKERNSAYEHAYRRGIIVLSKYQKAPYIYRYTTTSYIMSGKSFIPIITHHTRRIPRQYIVNGKLTLIFRGNVQRKSVTVSIPFLKWKKADINKRLILNYSTEVNSVR